MNVYRDGFVVNYFLCVFDTKSAARLRDTACMLTIYKSIICLMAQAGFRCFFLESGGHFNVNFNIQEYPWLMGLPAFDSLSRD